MSYLFCSHMCETFCELSFIIFSSPMSWPPVLCAWTTIYWLKTLTCPFAIKWVSGRCSSRNAWKKHLFFSSVDFPWNVQRKADAIQLFHTWFSVILDHFKPLLCLESCHHVWCDIQLFELCVLLVRITGHVHVSRLVSTICLYPISGFWYLV